MSQAKTFQSAHTDKKDDQSPTEGNQRNSQKIFIVASGIKVQVITEEMLKVSGLFVRKYKESNMKKDDTSQTYTLVIDTQYGGELLEQFFNICQGKSAEIKSMTDIFYLLLISEEWETPEISKQFISYLRSKNINPLEWLLKYVNEKDIPSVFIDFAASKFRTIFDSTEFLNLPPKCICSIIQNPNCEMPSRNVLEPFIVQIIEKHGIECCSLVKYVDFLNTSFENLTNLREILKKKKLIPMFPNVNRIWELRNNELEKDQLKNQVDALNRENKELRDDISILRRVNDKLEKENRSLKNSQNSNTD